MENIHKGTPIVYKGYIYTTISDEVGLHRTENKVAELELLSYLANNEILSGFLATGAAENARRDKEILSGYITDFLLKKIELHRRCEDCGKKLPIESYHKRCDECYSSQWDDWNYIY